MESKSEGKPKAAKRGLPKGYKFSNPSRRAGTGFIDLTGVPPQPLILKNQLSATCYQDNSRRRSTNAGSSKYTGIYYDKKLMKWKAQIMVTGVVRSIGYYDKEEDAAGDYARAAFKYKPKKQSLETYGGLDLRGVPKTLPLIPSVKSSSGYKGVKLIKKNGRFEARIDLGGKVKTLGTFDTAEEAALIHARAQYYLDQNGRSSDRNEKGKAVVLNPPSEETSGAIEVNTVSAGGKKVPINDEEIDEDPVDPCFIDEASDKVEGIAI